MFSGVCNNHESSIPFTRFIHYQALTKMCKYSASDCERESETRNRSESADGTEDSQCDTARMSLIVNTTIAPEPKQPNGRLFVTSLAAPKYDILSQTRSAAGDQVTLNWRSLSEATYGVDASSDLVNWTSRNAPGTNDHCAHGDG